MASKKCYTTIRFISGKVRIREYDEMGQNVLSSKSLGVILGLQLDQYFRYIHPATGEYKFCYMSSLKGPHKIYDDIPENAPAELKQRYIEAVKVALEIKGSTDWFNCRIVNIRIRNDPTYKTAYDSPYFEEYFVVRARDKLYRLNSSGSIEIFAFNPKTMTIIEEFDEGVFPPGTTNLSDALHSLSAELEQEYEEFLQLKKLYPNLITEDSNGNQT